MNIERPNIGPARQPGPHLVGDVWGGLAAMLVALPAAIAFGVTIFSPLGGALATEGALAGILGATALGLVAPLFGCGGRLISAPCAPAAAVLSALAAGFAAQGMPPPTALLLIGLIGLLAGAVQIALGVSGVGRLIKFIPYPVVSGYLSGVGLIIIGSQIPKLLGTPAGTGLIEALLTPAAWRWQSIAVGTAVALAMIFAPRIVRTVPAAILALLAGVGAYMLLGWAGAAPLSAEHNPLLLGPLSARESGLGQAVGQHVRALGGFGFDIVPKVIVPALTLGVLLSIDSLKTCLVIDALTGSHHDANRELRGQGLANIASSLIGGIPGAGTMGPSLINLSSGGTTAASGLMAGAFSLAAFLLLAPLIAWLPVAALAAILIVIGLRMIDRRSLSFFFTPSTRFDFLVILAVILVAIFGNLIAASGVGVALAILLFIREQTRSSVVRNRIEGREIFSKRLQLHQDLERPEREEDRTVIFELQGSLFFGTASQLQAALEPETGTRKYVILSMRRVQSLDVTATHVLEQIKDRLEEHDACLVFCDIPSGLPSGLKMKRFLKETGVVRPTNKAFAFRQLDEALDWVEAQEKQDADSVRHEGVPMELREMPVFAGLGEAALEALEAEVGRREAEAGKKIVKAGAGGDELLLIRRGSVKVMVPIRKKQSYHLSTGGPGEIVGGTAFVDTGRHAADVVAVGAVELYVLSRAGFERLAKDHPDIALALVQGIARNLSQRLRATIVELQALRG